MTALAVVYVQFLNLLGAIMDVSEINDVVKPLLLKDLRVQCRARGISPAGSREALADRLKDHMLVTGDT